jgi:hypothetical protein
MLKRVLIMFSSTTGTLSYIIEHCWQILFKKKPHAAAVQKITQFLTFGAGVLVAKIFSVTAQILMGRNLGPELYGQITIITLLASYFAMPMVNGWGLVFVKIAARKNEKSKQLQAVKSLLIVVLLLFVIYYLQKKSHFGEPGSTPGRIQVEEIIIED